MNSCVDESSRLFKMRRFLLHSRNQEDQASENIDTTPLRRSSVRFPRLRLLDDDFKLEDVSKPVVPSYQPTAIKPQPQIVKTYPFKLPMQTCLEDRFIRYKYNVEAANYLLTKKIDEPLEENELNVFKQVDSLSVKWRKKFMHQLMVKENVIAGVRQKHVLRGSHLSLENKLPGNLAGRPKELLNEEYVEDGMWKSKPRKRPLIGIMDSILDMHGFQTTSRHRRNLVDWGSNSIIAAAIQDMITFYDTNVSESVELQKSVEVSNVCVLKWNNAGNKLAICTLVSEVKLYCLKSQKMIWTTVCKSVVNYNSPCYVRSICWSENDQHIVTGCRGLLSVYLAKSGAVVKSCVIHTTGILTLVFSLNYRYLVSSGSDMNVRIFQWPSLAPILDITYFEPVIAIAWHPFDSGFLCIGGGVGDGSLSLWNVNKLHPVSYRHVEFFGGVEKLAWNKHSGELVVQWVYLEGQNRYTVMPVLASLDRVVDVVPVDKELRVNAITWNSDQTQLAVQYDDSLTMWNFFGDEYQCQKHKKHRKFRVVQNNTSSMNFKEFKHFNIR